LEFTKDFVHSVKSSHYDLDFIFFDNGSTDGSSEWLEDEIPHSTIIKCSHNLGISQAFNALMMEAKNRDLYSHVIYSNNDVICRRETIDSLVWAWDNREDDRIVKISGVDVREDDRKSLEEAKQYVFNYNITKPYFTYGGCYTIFVWDSEAMEKAGLLNPLVDYYGDNIHAEEINRRGLTGVTFAPAIILHRGSATLKTNLSVKHQIGQKSAKDQAYAFKYFGIKDSFIDTMNILTNEALEIWQPRLLKINTKLIEKELTYVH